MHNPNAIVTRTAEAVLHVKSDNSFVVLFPITAPLSTGAKLQIWQAQSNECPTKQQPNGLKRHQVQFIHLAKPNFKPSSSD